MAVIRGLDRRLFLIAAIGGSVALFFILKGGDSTETKKESGETFLVKVMQASGGVDSYEAIKTISFTKNFKLYRKDGSTEMDRKEIHTSKFKPQKSHSIRWTENDTLYEIIENNESIAQYVNETKDFSTKEETLYDKLYAATFVFGLPYTLDVPTNKKTYAGLVNFEEKEAHALKTAFAESADVWTLYYEQDDLDWIGYWVKTPDHYSLVINNEMTQVNGFTFPRKRKSYRTDSLQNKLYLRAEYVYDNYEIK